MIEPLGPNMARTILGEDYSPDYRYELETTESGLQVIITEKATGKSSIRRLADDQVDSVHYDRLYDEDREAAIREYTKRSFRGAFLAFLLFLVACVVLCVVVYFISLKAGGVGA